MLIISVSWYFENEEKEPLIISLGQLATLLTLVFEKQASKIFTKNIDNALNQSAITNSEDLLLLLKYLLI